ncbi:tRNA1(Val) (adenine(37)-N6)-methyltransferase [Treponema sp.]|uniref:tRNA1(Val) (adenine(37)-N6)-methyltransferase n=1 Tax=Treponema sp. TaxID=166 RepID=UPI003FD82483
MAERLDKLHLDGYSILQDKKKFCYGVDAVLLADFALKNTKNRIKSFEANKDFLFIDLGTGNGIIPILLAAKTGSRVKIQGIEIQAEIAEMAYRSVKINSLEERIEILEGDIKKIPQTLKGGFAQAVVSNPPYMIVSQGRQSDNFAKMVARQEILCCLEDVVRAADFLLEDGGSFFMIHRARRLKDIFFELEKFDFKNIFWQSVKPFKEKDATMVLIMAKKNLAQKNKTEVFGGDEKIQLEDLIIYDEEGKYTQKILEIYGRKS